MSSRNYDAFIAKMRAEGIDAYHANQYPEAREAYQLDQQADWNAQVAKKRTDFKPVKADGSPMTTFENKDQLRAAMSDPLYKASSEYRAKVQEMMIGMEDDGILTGTDVQGMGGLRGMSPEKMLIAASKEAAISKYKQLAKEASTDPVKRLELMQLVASPDPTVQAWLHEGTSSVNTEGPLNRAMREKGHGTFGSDLGAAMAGNIVKDEGEKK